MTNDKLDNERHDYRETAIRQYQRRFKRSRRQALEDFVAHAENDPDSPVYCTAPVRPEARA